MHVNCQFCSSVLLTARIVASCEKIFTEGNEGNEEKGRHNTDHIIVALAFFCSIIWMRPQAALSISVSPWLREKSLIALNHWFKFFLFSQRHGGTETQSTSLPSVHSCSIFSVAAAIGAGLNWTFALRLQNCETHD